MMEKDQHRYSELDRLKQAKSLRWIWHDEEKKLGDLHPKQLLSILDTLNKKNDVVWFGVHGSIWKTAIRQIIRHEYPVEYRNFNNRVLGDQIIS